MEADAKDFWNNSMSFEDEYSGWGLSKLSVFNIFKKKLPFLVIFYCVLLPLKQEQKYKNITRKVCKKPQKTHKQKAEFCLEKC